MLGSVGIVVMSLTFRGSHDVIGHVTSKGQTRDPNTWSL